MGQAVEYERHDNAALVRVDDGKRNALTPDILTALDQALDRAEDDGAPIVLTGREGVLSAGFDLRLLRSGGPDALRMVNHGLALAERLYAFPTPVIVASPGHAIAMGLFLVLASDYRIGTDGDYKYQANEVANGLTVPRCALALCRHRIDRAHLTRVVVLAEPFGPKDARDAGLIDRVVPAGELISEALTVAGQAAALDMKAYSATKRRLRRSALGAMRRGRRRDMADFTAIGLKRMVQPPARSH